MIFATETQRARRKKKEVTSAFSLRGVGPLRAGGCVSSEAGGEYQSFSMAARIDSISPMVWALKEVFSSALPKTTKCTPAAVAAS